MMHSELKRITKLSDSMLTSVRNMKRRYGSLLVELKKNRCAMYQRASRGPDYFANGLRSQFYWCNSTYKSASSNIVLTEVTPDVCAIMAEALGRPHSKAVDICAPYHCELRALISPDQYILLITLSFQRSSRGCLARCPTCRIIPGCTI